MKGKAATIRLLRKRKVYLHISLPKSLVRWLLIHYRAFDCLTLMILGKAKKARVNPSEDDLFLESDDQDDTPSAFSQTLSRFKKSPKKKGKLDNYCPRILIV